MAKKLSAGVLQGTDYKENFEVTWNDEKFEVEIRALDNEESSSVEELTQEGINLKAKPGINGKMTRSMDFDMKANFRGRKESNIKAVVLGTIDESITDKVVRKEFPPNITEEIGERVKQISGIEDTQEVEDFNEGKENPSDSNGE